MPNRSRLIVAETEPYLQVILDAALGESAKVEHISQSKECLAELENVDGVFVDLMLDDLDGLSLIETIRLRDRELPIIAFVTQNEIVSLNIQESATRAMAEHSGADAVFFAPFNLGEILHATNRLLLPVAEIA
ncbi:response regulator [bacterium]|nr:response regulator [bacterium]